MKLKIESLSYKNADRILTAAVVLLAVVLNLALSALASTFSLYVAATPAYKHSVGEGTVDFLENIYREGDRVTVTFCQPADALEADPTYNLVWQTALQLEEALDFVSVRTVNIYTDPEQVEPFRYEEVWNEETGAYETQKVNAITTSSVIVSGGDRHSVLTMAAFFILDRNQVIRHYNGEEILSAQIRYVLAEQTPTAYYTYTHGEEASAALYNLYTCAGYRMQAIDLLEDSPEDTSGILLVINPRYDFVKGAEGVTAEIERVRAFVEAGGMLQVYCDPLAEGLTNLEAFLSETGLSPTHAIIRDPATARSVDGCTFLGSYAEGAEAEALAEVAEQYQSQGVLVRDAAPIAISARAGYTAAPLLVSSPSSRAYVGEEMTEEGSLPFAAVSTREGGGAVLLVMGYYVGASDALDTDAYGNEEFFYGALTRYRGTSSPIGATLLAMTGTALEDLTRRQATWLSLAVTLPLPLGALVCGGMLIRRRRGR